MGNKRYLDTDNITMTNIKAIELRETAGFNCRQAAEFVNCHEASWYQYESKKGTTISRIMPINVLQLFVLKAHVKGIPLPGWAREYVRKIIEAPAKTLSKRTLDAMARPGYKARPRPSTKKSKLKRRKGIQEQAIEQEVVETIPEPIETTQEPAIEMQESKQEDGYIFGSYVE